MSQKAIEVLELCERAMRENEGQRDTVTIIVNTRGRKAGSTHRLFPECPRGRVIKRFRIGRNPYFSVEYNAKKLSESIADKIAAASAFKNEMMKHTAVRGTTVVVSTEADTTGEIL